MTSIVVNSTNKDTHKENITNNKSTTEATDKELDGENVTVSNSVLINNDAKPEATDSNEGVENTDGELSKVYFNIDSNKVH